MCHLIACIADIFNANTEDQFDKSGTKPGDNYTFFWIETRMLIVSYEAGYFMHTAVTSAVKMAKFVNDHIIYITQV
jgi:hypothetical protein